MTSETELAIEPEIEPATAEIIALPTAAPLPAEPDQLAGLARKIGDLLGRVNEIGARYHTEAYEAWTAALATHARTLEDIKSREAAETKDLRLEAGRLLIEAKALVPAGTWLAWLAENVKRSQSDCYACMKMAGAVNPGRERAKERENTRERVQKHREGKRAAATAAKNDAVSVTRDPVTETTPEPDERNVEFYVRVVADQRVSKAPHADWKKRVMALIDECPGNPGFALAKIYKQLSPGDQALFRHGFEGRRRARGVRGSPERFARSRQALVETPRHSRSRADNAGRSHDQVPRAQQSEQICIR
jgi:hypothetical protein